MNWPKYLEKGEQVVGDLIVYLLQKVSECKKNQLITIALVVAFWVLD